MQDKVNDLQVKIDNLSIQSTPIKKIALQIEKESFKAPQSSLEAQEVVSKVLNAPEINENGKIQCEICRASGIEKFCLSEQGLKVHLAWHKRKNK